MDLVCIRRLGRRGSVSGELVERQDQGSAPLREDGSPCRLEWHVAKLKLAIVCAHRWSRMDIIPAQFSFDTRFNVWGQDCRLMYARFLRRQIVPEMRVNAADSAPLGRERWNNGRDPISHTTVVIPLCAIVHKALPPTWTLCAGGELLSALLALLYHNGVTRGRWNHRLPTRAELATEIHTRILPHCQMASIGPVASIPHQPGP